MPPSGSRGAFTSSMGWRKASGLITIGVGWAAVVALARATSSFGQTTFSFGGTTSSFDQTSVVTPNASAVAFILSV